MSRKKMALEVFIQHAVLNSLGDMAWTDLFLSFQIGDRPRHFKYSHVCSSAEAQLVDRHLQKLSSLRRHLAEFFHLSCPHPGIGKYLFSLVSLELSFSRRNHSAPDLRRTFPFMFRDNLFEPDFRHFDLNIDPVEKRPGNF